jgi:hypothetical protein
LTVSERLVSSETALWSSCPWMKKEIKQLVKQQKIR